MAKLDPRPYPGNWEMNFNGDINDEINRTDQMLQNLILSQPKSTDNSLVGAVIRFQVGDGYAVYIVSQDKPLTLRHIPFGDAWHVDRCTMKGIDKIEIRRQLKASEFSPFRPMRD